MVPTSKLRRLFQALSVLSAITCVLLIVLWVRSYVWMDAVIGPLSSTRGVAIGTMPGRLMVQSGDRSRQPQTLPQWELRSESVEVMEDIARDSQAMGRPSGPTNFLVILGFASSSSIESPIWLPVVISGTLAAVLGIRRPFRFNLRTLLIATTLVAVAMGMVAWAASYVQ